MKRSQNIYNIPENIVEEAIDGLVFSSNNIARLNGYPDIKVAVRSDWRQEIEGESEVAIISGGGSGHEPAHGGLVGKGMLTAAVCGDIFASPGVDSILSALVHVTGRAGCLIILKNYTGDRIAFGLAAEKAKQMGLKVEVVMVGDDIALEGVPPRGLAGTLFIHKIAGAMAAKGASLAEIYQTVSGVCESIVSLGVSLSTCAIPGSAVEERIPVGKMEIGLGIHGEPGAETGDLLPADVLVEKIVVQLAEHLPPNTKYAVLINNLGSVSNLEMAVVVNALMKSSFHSSIDLLIGPSHLMTSLSMNGFSFSVLPITTSLREYLTFAIPEVPLWKPAVSPKMKQIELPQRLTTDFTPSQNFQVEKFIRSACEALCEAEAELNTIDHKVGDGDTGSTFAKAAKGLLSLLSNLPQNDPPRLSLAIGDSLSRLVGGSSGVLLSIFFTALSQAMEENGENWGRTSVQKGLAAMMKYGGAKLGDRTMLDAMIPAAEAIDDGVEAMAKAAMAGVEKTKSIVKTRAGRSSYVPEQALCGVPDPGAVAIAIIIQSWL